MAAVEWLPDRAIVPDLVLDVSDAGIIEASEHADKVGLDCPLGWPELFVALVRAHEVVREETGIIPLSVAADRIAHAAFRGAGLLAMFAAARHDVDRCRGGRAISEGVPAAAGAASTRPIPQLGHEAGRPRLLAQRGATDSKW
ncbi:DUF429 domain-containing protein [Micromonospora sp. NPDC048839]|uniref:DUF429 domain-containing protein n=1 Tax=Micromonospora sp. NPDC048839 TaxID=3155641 RepID=UPI0033FE4CFE